MRVLESEDLGYRPDFLTNGWGDYGHVPFPLCTPFLFL